MFYQPKTTWTATFYLLPCKNHKTPAAAEQQQHLVAGLGRRKILFDNKEGDRDYLISVLSGGRIPQTEKNYCFHTVQMSVWR